MSNVGRPPINNEAMSKLIKVRASDEEYEQLRMYCDERNASLSEVVRKAIKQHMEVDRNES